MSIGSAGLANAGRILSSNWPSLANASTKSSCLPVGKDNSSDNASLHPGARRGKNTVFADIRALILCAFCSLSFASLNSSMATNVFCALIRSSKNGAIEPVMFSLPAAHRSGRRRLTISSIASTAERVSLVVQNQSGNIQRFPLTSTPAGRKQKRSRSSPRLTA